MHPILSREFQGSVSPIFTAADILPKFTSRNSLVYLGWLLYPARVVHLCQTSYLEVKNMFRFPCKLFLKHLPGVLLRRIPFWFQVHCSEKLHSIIFWCDLGYREWKQYLHESFQYLLRPALHQVATTTVRPSLVCWGSQGGARGSQDYRRHRGKHWRVI